VERRGGHDDDRSDSVRATPARQVLDEALATSPRGGSRRKGVAALAVGVLLALAGCSGSATSDAADAAAPSTPAAEEGGLRAADVLTFTAPTLDGADLDASTLEGRAVVLWFWAPWCTICRAEAPDVVRVAQDLEGDVTFLGVPGLGRTANMHDFVADTGTGGFRHVIDVDGELWRRFGVISQPAFAFVDPDGSVEVFVGSLGEAELARRAAALAA
jgi:thiol-disulfide isomerase/thioredoxin